MYPTTDDAQLGFWMGKALEYATQSPDPSTQNGALLLNPIGQLIGGDCNQFPKGVEYNEARWERPTKYAYIEHAERNSIFKAARYGVSTLNATMVCPWAACSDCARAIVQAGVKTLVRLYYSMDATNDRWRLSCEDGDNILNEGGVEILEYNGDLGEIPRLRRDGELWVPELSHVHVNA